MGTMNKSTLLKKVSEDTALHPNLVKEVVDSFLYIIVEEYKKGNRVEVREFGTFFPYTRKPRIYKTFETGETRKMVKKKIMKFKCSRQLHL